MWINSLNFKSVVLSVSFITLSFGVVTTASAEEKFEEILARATKLKEEGQYSKAITELGWATEQLQKLHSEKLQSFFPQAVDGVTPEQFEANSAMGIMVVERPYKTAEGAEIKVTLTGASTTQGGANQGLGALAGFAQMAAMMDQGPGTEAVRIQGQRAQVSDSSGKLTLTLPLSGGMLLSVEQESGEPAKEKLVAIAEKFDVNGLTKYMAAN